MRAVLIKRAGGLGVLNESGVCTRRRVDEVADDGDAERYERGMHVIRANFGRPSTSLVHNRASACFSSSSAHTWALGYLGDSSAVVSRSLLCPSLSGNAALSKSVLPRQTRQLLCLCGTGSGSISGRSLNLSAAAVW